MKHRSPGQGMFIKIQKYNQYNKIKPFKLFYSKNDLNNKNTRRFDKNIIIRNNKLKLPFYFQTSKDKMNDLSNLNNKNKTQKILKHLKN